MRSWSRWRWDLSVAENSDDTGAVSDLIPPNCGVLNMENGEAAKMFIVCDAKGLCSDMNSMTS